MEQFKMNARELIDTTRSTVAGDKCLPTMDEIRERSHELNTLYPLRFEPIYQYRLWGGRRLADVLTAPLPGDGPIGEAWVLSDRQDHQSRVADGPLKGQGLGQLLDQFPQHMMGALVPWPRRFPLLLKFLDARGLLSVQVHASVLPVSSAGR